MRLREAGVSWQLAAGVVVALGLVVASLLVGQYHVFSADDGMRMFFLSRVPRTVTLVLAGAIMAVSGSVMQQLTQNRFVEPTTTGTTEWAALGLLLVMIMWPEASLLAKLSGAIVVAFFGTMVFFLMLRRVELKSAITVPIVGIMLAAVVSAIKTFVALSVGGAQGVSTWFTGSFISAISGQYEPIYLVIVVLILIFVTADRFAAAGLGEDVATSIGLNYQKVVLLGTVLVALATGTVVVVVGQLPFLGLLVPNLVALVRGDHLRSNLPWVVVVSIITVTACDILARVVIAPFEMPVGVILSIFGGAVFIFLVLRGRGADS
ncbi:MAG: iron chelate uptake ABC transporter family permease subunit [Actinomycetaceae bacterium]|nr:iron chelate uptake ABC transporter family permease subunit [Actinomycetaceae bacterium]